MARRKKIGVVRGGLEPLPAPAPGLVRLRAVDVPSLGVVAELNGPVTPSDYVTLETIDRRGKTPITDWAGYPALKLEIPMLFDRWVSQRSVEPEIRALELMYGRRGAERPAVLIVEGMGIPHSSSSNPAARWILTGDPEWNKDEQRTCGTEGSRCYVPVTVNVMQYSRPLVLDERGGVRQLFKVESSGPRTLRAIAKKFRIDWVMLKQLNRASKNVPKDPDKTIKRGTNVRVK